MFRKLRPIFILALVLATLGINRAGAGDDDVLAYRFVAGQKNAYKVKFTQEVDFGGMAVSVFADMEVTEECTKTTDSVSTIAITFDRVEASRSMMERMRSDPMGESLSGKAVTFQVDRHGKVRNVEPLGSIEGWEQSRDVIKNICEGWYAYFPGQAVPVGGSWTEAADVDSSSGMMITTNGKYTYKELKKDKGRDCSRIEGLVENLIGGTARFPQGDFSADGKGKGSMDMMYDARAGVIVRMKAKMDVKIVMTPVDGGDDKQTIVTYTTERELK